MKISARSHVIMAIATVFFIGACGVGGEVVKVTTVRGGSYAGLKETDLAKLDEIKKTRGDKGIDNSLKTVIEATKHFSVGEYLLKYPKARGPARGDYRVGGYGILNIQ